MATLPAYLNALAGRGVHVVTVNDYLAKRDAEWMGRIYRFLGLSVGVVVHGLTDKERQDSYRAEITYGQNNEFGFDYLRDNMKFRLADYVQRELNFAIVDEVDSILIDEARTPLIISGPAEESSEKYYRINQIIPSLLLDQDFTIDEEARQVMLTDDGVLKVERKLGVDNPLRPRSDRDPAPCRASATGPRPLQARSRLHGPERRGADRRRVHRPSPCPGPPLVDGLHQAVEAKEGVKIENENQTMATISFQNYFRMYSRSSRA